MATLISKVNNLTSAQVDVFVPGYNPTQPLVQIPGSALAYDLLSNISYEQLWAVQNELTRLIGEGILSSAGTFITTSIEGPSGITQLTGDVTAGPGSGSQVATLATVNTHVGSFTSANITVNAKGLITSAANGSGGGSSVHSYIPTINGFGTPTSVQFFYKTDGAAITVWGAFISGTSGGTTNISVPINIATAHMPSDVTVLGQFLVGLGITAPQSVVYDGSTATSVSFNLQSMNTDTNPIPLTTGDNLANSGDHCTVTFTYPIA